MKLFNLVIFSFLFSCGNYYALKEEGAFSLNSKTSAKSIEKKSGEFKRFQDVNKDDGLYKHLENEILKEDENLLLKHKNLAQRVKKFESSQNEDMMNVKVTILDKDVEEVNFDSVGIRDDKLLFINKDQKSPFHLEMKCFDKDLPAFSKCGNKVFRLSHKGTVEAYTYIIERKGFGKIQNINFSKNISKEKNLIHFFQPPVAAKNHKTLKNIHFSSWTVINGKSAFNMSWNADHSKNLKAAEALDGADFFGSIENLSTEKPSVVIFNSPINSLESSKTSIADYIQLASVKKWHKDSFDFIINHSEKPQDTTFMNIKLEFKPILNL